MNIDITELNNGITNTILISENVSFSNDLLEKMEIEDLRQVKIDGSISKNEVGEYVLSGTITGEMIILDAISLDNVYYPFSCQIDAEIIENPENLVNSLDIIDILWQNIMLEIPLKLTEVKDFSKYQGNGWKLFSEEEIKQVYNPFSSLKDTIGEE